MTKDKETTEEQPEHVVLTKEKLEQVTTFCAENDIPIKEFINAIIGVDIANQTEYVEMISKKREKEIRATHIEYGNARLTPVTREKFLKKLRETGNVSLAAALVGVSRRRAYQYKKKDKEFAKRWDEAREIGLDNIEHEAVRRSTKGVTKPVFYKGQICGFIQEYSDKLLEMLLRGRRGRVYDRTITDLPPGSEIAIIIRTGDGKEGKAIDVTPKQIEEEVAITD